MGCHTKSRGCDIVYLSIKGDAMRDVDTWLDEGVTGLDRYLSGGIGVGWVR